MSYEAVCVGETMALVAPDPPRPLREAGPLRIDIAGAESNVAIYLASLGVRVAWRSRVGADPFGQLCTDRLTAAGVDVSLVEVDPHLATGVFFKDPGPAATTVYYYRRDSAAAAMDASIWVDPPATKVVHLSGVTPALSPSCAELVSHALTRRPVAGALMSFDVNYRPALWPVEVAGPALAKLADAADVVLVGLDEAATLWGTEHPEQVRDRLPTPRTLVVKDGAVGATSYHRESAAHPDGTTFVPASPVAVVEPVGAGDAFAAGYLFGAIRDLPEPVRLRLGHLLAGSALRVVGDIGAVPPVAELLDAAESGVRDEVV